MGLGSSPFARHYLGNHYCFLFLRLLRCFSSPGLPAHLKDVAHPVFNGIGFPIRRSAGQRLLATSPQLIAGCYVLHRLFESRHPPYTLTRFSHTSIFKSVDTLYTLYNLHYIYWTPIFIFLSYIFH